MSKNNDKYIIIKQSAKMFNRLITYTQIMVHLQEPTFRETTSPTHMPTYICSPYMKTLIFTMAMNLFVLLKPPTNSITRYRYLSLAPNPPITGRPVPPITGRPIPTWLPVALSGLSPSLLIALYSLSSPSYNPLITDWQILITEFVCF